MNRFVFPLYCAAVVLLALASYLLPATSPPLPAGVFPAVTGELSKVVSSVYAPDGFRRYRSESARVRHLRENRTLVLDPLEMQYYADGVQTMSLRSESGSVLQKGRLVRLDGAVELIRPAGAGDVAETVNTRDVEIKTEEWIAVTQERVVVRRSGQRMTGRGMVADLKRGEISLLGDVKGRHGS